MISFKKVYAVLSLCLLTACLSCMSTSSSGTSKIQKITISVSHNIKYDLAIWKKRNVYCLPVIIADQPYLKNFNIAQQMPGMLGPITEKLKIPSYQKTAAKFTRASLAKKYSNVRKVYFETGEMPEQSLKSIALEIGCDTVIIPVIVRAETETLRSYSGEIDKSGSLEIKLYFIDIKWMTTDKTYVSFEASPSSTETYDTESSIAYKKRMKEKALKDFDRSVERQRKEAEREQKRSEKENGKPSGAEVIFDLAAGALDEYDFSKEREKIENSKEFEIHGTYVPGNTEFLMTMLTSSMEKLIGDLDNLFDGTTISGNCETGTGVFEFANGGKYSGEWENGFAHGKGIVTINSEYINKEIYGIFREGILVEEINPLSLPGSTGGIDSGQ
jgi:hypothetical protein